MPPNRSQPSQDSMHQEGKILLALHNIKNDRFKSIRATATVYDISPSTLRDRTNRVISRVGILTNSHKLTQLEEDSLVE
ncbi:hypothetical protein PENSUB_13977 [Penicillium subrubescens]|uniref:HTH psq-type domain-containing protein n=1 Tax=Penicillium subrubescens TaxID=1316194 RepID=A0A1Q5UPW8_9EURO|nr:hypothetical protein PENSUB_13977 [Penicillium subrubescens]